MVGRRGQAALADALYFLLIVSVLSSMFFFFVGSYGNLMSERILLQYRAEYATSALKTLLYSSTPRIEGTTLEDATEVDFLLAAIKEDFADNGEFDYVQSLIVNNVGGLMEPLADSFNYMYYIYLPDRQEFAFLMLYHSEWPDWEGPKGIRADVKKGTSIVSLCKPDKLDDLDVLVTNVGKTYQENSRVQLVKIKQTGGQGYDVFSAQVNLTMWVSTALPDITNLNCECFQELREDRALNENRWQECI